MPTTREVFKTAKEKGMVIEINDNIKLIKEFDNKYHCEITTFLDKCRKRYYKNVPTTHNWLHISDKNLLAIDSHNMVDMMIPIRMLGMTRGYIALDEYRKITYIKIYHTDGYKRKTNKLIQKFIGRYIEVE